MANLNIEAMMYQTSHRETPEKKFPRCSVASQFAVQWSQLANTQRSM